MKSIKRNLILLSLLVSGTMMAQRSLNILFMDKTSTSKSVSAIQSITFSSGTMVVKSNANTTDAYATSNIRHLKFSTASEVNTTWADGASLTLFPNPVRNTLFLKNGKASTEDVQIYGIDGALVMVAPFAQFEVGVDLSSLSSGIYFLKSNGKTLKFIKL